jgi:thioredoxin 1
MLITIADANFEEFIISHESIIIYFHAEWCGMCKQFFPKFSRLAEDSNNGEITFVSINAELNKLSSKLSKVDGLPFIASFKNGKLLEGLATTKEENLVKVIRNIKT